LHFCGGGASRPEGPGRPAADRGGERGRGGESQCPAQGAEEYRLLGLLGDTELESVALWRMEGFTVEEIADRLGYAPRSVKRKLQLIRSVWEKEAGP